MLISSPFPRCPQDRYFEVAAEIYEDLRMVAERWPVVVRTPKSDRVKRPMPLLGIGSDPDEVSGLTAAGGAVLVVFVWWW